MPDAPIIPSISATDPSSLGAAGGGGYAPATGRTALLGKLSSQVSGQIAQGAGQQQAARVAGMQTQVQQAAAAGSRATAGQLQAAGGQQAQAAGDIGVQAASMAMQRQGQIGAMGLQEGYMANQAYLASRKAALSADNRALQEKLSSVSIQIKQELMDKQTSFAQDAMGRTLFNDRQLTDLAIYKAKSQEDLASYEQQVQEVSAKRMALLRQSHATISQAMEQGSAAWNQQQGEALKVKLLAAQQAVELKIKQEQAAQRSRAAIFSAAGTVVGMGVGAFFGGPAGAMAGGAAGGGLGNVAAGAMT